MGLRCQPWGIPVTHRISIHHSLKVSFIVLSRLGPLEMLRRGRATPAPLARARQGSSSETKENFQKGVCHGQ